jgi:hypothetical protein
VVTGGATDMVSIQKALRDTLPSVDSWRFKTLEDPAFVLSLGAAATARRKLLFEEKWECQCDDLPSPINHGSYHTEDEKQEMGRPLNSEWPCNMHL